MTLTQRTGSHRRLAETLADTQLTLSERMADPALTAHDQWVLRCFSEFLAVLVVGDTRPPTAVGAARRKGFGPPKA